MRIGIDGSRAFIKQRTGIEEYSYQVIRHLTAWLCDEEVFLYVRKNQEVDFEIPAKWKIRKLWFPRFWTQIRLSLAIVFDSIDSLFIPAHTVPIFHPKKTTVVVHGLEYEFCPEAYSWFERVYMRFVIRNSCRWASNIISVSENTKKDLVDLYKIPEQKITVIYEGYSQEESVFQQSSYSGLENEKAKILLRNFQKYILFVGRIEKRKNVANIVKAFETIKAKYGVSHILVLAGKPGYGFADIAKSIGKSPFSKDVLELGYVSEHDKWALLKKADVFVFPSLYEGFGLPILEAQKMLVPVVTSKISSIPEVADDAVLYADPNNPDEIGENIYLLISNEKAREDMIKRGLGNLERFDWTDCAKQLADKIRE